MDMVERVARALLAALEAEAVYAKATDNDLAKCMVDGGLFDIKVVARAVIAAMREPTMEQLAVVVQQVGDPSRANWETAEKVCASLFFPSMEGETAIAELARDWSSMIDAALSKP